MKFQVDRTKWLRGKGPSQLLSPNGQMCCVGFFCLAEGYKPEDIANAKVYGELRDKSHTEDKFAIHNIYIINDAPHLEKTREALLTKEFKYLGHEVEFIN